MGEYIKIKGESPTTSHSWSGKPIKTMLKSEAWRKAWSIQKPATRIVEVIKTKGKGWTSGFVHKLDLREPTTQQIKSNQKWLNVAKAKQTLPTIGRTVITGARIATGWIGIGAAIGTSLFAQTKQGKAFTKKIKTRVKDIYTKGKYASYLKANIDYHKGKGLPYNKNYIRHNYWTLGTKPQKIKHFPAQRIKTKDPASVRRLLPRLGRN